MRTTVDGTVALGASESHTGQTGGEMTRVDVEFTRPANATLYTAKDVVSDSGTAPQTVTNAARVNGGSGYIVGVTIQTDQVANVETFRVHASTTTFTLPADNAPFTRLYTNRLIRLPHVDVGPLSTEGTGSDAAGASNTDIRIPFTCAGGSRHLYYALECLNGFTPAPGQKITVSFWIDQN